MKKVIHLEHKTVFVNICLLPDLPKALYRLLKNPVYVCMIAGSSFNWFLSGFSAFTPKYMETYFGVTASRASLITGNFKCI